VVYGRVDATRVFSLSAILVEPEIKDEGPLELSRIMSIWTAA
jgi:hypothetical protein